MVIASKINGRRPATALHIRLPRIGSQVGARNNAQLETGAPKVNTPLMTINHPKLKQNMADVIGRPPLSLVRFAINFPKQEIRSHGAPAANRHRHPRWRHRATGCSASRCKSGARASLPASAAEFAGLQRADLITPIAGPCISTPRIHQTLATVGAAQTVKLKIQRGRKPMELSITAADL